MDYLSPEEVTIHRQFIFDVVARVIGATKLDMLLDRALHLRSRNVTVIDGVTGRPLAARVRILDYGGESITYVLVSSKGEQWGDMIISVKPKQPLYVETLVNGTQKCWNDLSVNRVKRVGEALLDQAFLLGEAYGQMLDGRNGLRLEATMNSHAFYWINDFLPEEDELDYRKSVFDDLSEKLSSLKASDRGVEENPDFRLAREIFAKWRRKPASSISRQELFTRWPTFSELKPRIKYKRSEKIKTALEIARKKRTKAVTSELENVMMFLSPVGIERKTQRFAKVLGYTERDSKIELSHSPNPIFETRSV